MTLQEKIEALNPDTKNFIMSCNNVQELILLKKTLDNPNITDVVNARLENLTHLSV